MGTPVARPCHSPRPYRRHSQQKPLITQGIITVGRTAQLIDQPRIDRVTKQLAIGCHSRGMITPHRLVQGMRLEKNTHLALRIRPLTAAAIRRWLTVEREIALFRGRPFLTSKTVAYSLGGAGLKRSDKAFVQIDEAIGHDPE